MNERGSFLITALWAVSMFSIMTAGLAFWAGEEMILMKRELEGLENRADFASGLNMAVRMIQEDPTPHEDSKEKEWFGDIKLEEFLGARLSIHVEDEESKLNLNYASRTFLESFFKKYDEEINPLKSDRKDLAMAILKLRDAKRIASLEELLLLEEFEGEDFDALRSYLTVYPELPLINPNTASFLILKALVESLNGDHGSKHILISRLEEACGKDGCFFRSGDLTPGNFSEKLKLPKNPMMMQLTQEFLVNLTVDSTTFRVVMKSADGAKARGIFVCRAGQGRPEVYGWHED